MPIEKLIGFLPLPTLSTGKTAPDFGAALALAGARSSAVPPFQETAPIRTAAGPGPGAVSLDRSAPPAAGSARTPRMAGGRAVDVVAAAQAKLDRVLQLAQSGKSFTPGELLSMQAQVYGASQQLDLATRVVEKATSGVKQVLQTQI